MATLALSRRARPNCDTDSCAYFGYSGPGSVPVASYDRAITDASRGRTSFRHCAFPEELTVNAVQTWRGYEVLDAASGSNQIDDSAQRG